MPLKDYFQGSGEKVMKSMKKQYGARAEDVFYATANKQKMTPKSSGVKKAMKRTMGGGSPEDMINKLEKRNKKLSSFNK